MAENKKAAINSYCVRRLQKELRDITDHPPPLIQARIKGENLLKWIATIQGPPGTPYEGGKFHLLLNFKSDYPFSPPHVKFITKIYHANIGSDGTICLDILSTEWSPALTVSTLLLSIASLLADCNPRSPLRVTIANLYETNRERHDQTAREFTKTHAMR